MTYEEISEAIVTYVELLLTKGATLADINDVLLDMVVASHKARGGELAQLQEMVIDRDRSMPRTAK